MANLEVLALDTATPQIRAPGAGDGYSVPRDMTLASGTTLTAPTVNATTVDATNVEVTNVKAKDGTAAITIADSTGNVSLSANLTFSGTAQRITGDMSNATLSNRLLFQNSVTNGNTVVGAIPNGTGTAGAIVLYNSSDPANASIADFRAQASTDVRITSGINGTGTYLPMTFYTGGSERMRIDSSGNVGIGGTADAFAKFKIAGTLPTSSTISVVNYNQATIPSGTTSTAYGYYSALGTEAASFTLSGLIHYYINPGTFGAGSTVTSQYGYYCDSTLTGATNNYGFFSNIASGSNRWNFYANGTADNYFAGNCLFGKTTTNVDTVGSRIDNAGRIFASISTQETLYVRDTGAAAYRFYVTSGGTIFATNTTISAISDQRYKENVRDLDVGLDAIMALKPRKFDWKEGKGKNIKGDRGFIAQEFEQVFPDLVDTWKDPAPEGEEPYKSMRQDLIPVLVKAMQEQQNQIKALQDKIVALESK